MPIIINRLEKKGKPWPHKHKWIPLKDHIRGGDVAFCFMLEPEERDRVEMCLTCSARKMSWKKGSEDKKPGILDVLKTG